MKMKRYAAVLLVLTCVCVLSCRRQDTRIVKVSVPGMKTEKCAEIVKKAVTALPGVYAERTEIDLKGRTVTVSYESLVTARKNIEFAIADAGFAANDVPAAPEAAKALPPECSP
jgi:copper chaperone CopZ